MLSNEPDPFTLWKEHIDELVEQAGQFLDGSPVETEAQAEDVSRLLNMIRKAKKDADDRRAEEKRPHDEAAKAVQAKWKPLLDSADLAVTTCKRALEPFLRKQEEAQRAAAEAARMEAEEKAAAARKAAEEAGATDLAGQTTARALQENAAAAEKLAARLEKQRAHARGGERAIGLRTYWTAEITDATAFARWVWANRKSEMMEFLEAVARREAVGPKDIPGLKIIEQKRAA